MEHWVYTFPIHRPITTLSSVSSIYQFVPVSYDKVLPVLYSNPTLFLSIDALANIQPRLSPKPLLQTLIVPKNLHEEQP
jgi:hypothetical protein